MRNRPAVVGPNRAPEVDRRLELTKQEKKKRSATKIRIADLLLEAAANDIEVAWEQKPLSSEKPPAGRIGAGFLTPGSSALPPTFPGSIRVAA